MNHIHVNIIFLVALQNAKCSFALLCMVCIDLILYLYVCRRRLCCGWFTTPVKNVNWLVVFFLCVDFFLGDVSYNFIRTMLVCLFYAKFSSLCGFIYFFLYFRISLVHFHSIFEYVVRNPNEHLQLQTFVFFCLCLSACFSFVCFGFHILHFIFASLVCSYIVL